MSEKVIQFGVHYMLDGYGANPDQLKDKNLLYKVLTDVPASMSMHTICEPIVVEVGPRNSKDPGGVSGFVMIAESHISFHTFPSRGFITIDVYTCQDKIDANKLTQEFVKHFSLRDYNKTLVKRGTKYPVEDIYKNIQND